MSKSLEHLRKLSRTRVTRRGVIAAAGGAIAGGSLVDLLRTGIEDEKKGEALYQQYPHATRTNQEFAAATKNDLFKDALNTVKQNNQAQQVPLRNPEAILKSGEIYNQVDGYAAERDTQLGEFLTRCIVDLAGIGGGSVVATKALDGSAPQEIVPAQ